MINLMRFHVSVLLFSMVTTFNLNSLCMEHAPFATCNVQEREALLCFKQGLIDPWKNLSSWSDQRDNCCAWTGVHCNNVTGRVKGIDLGYYFLSGEISKSLLELKFISYLNLSYNDFNQAQIPKFLGSMISLRHVDLSFSNFSGLVPPELGNISRLTFLDLGNDYHNMLYVDNLQWISKLPNLKYLSLDGVDLHKEDDWLGVMNMLPSLVHLSLRDCQLFNMIQPTEFGNFTSLEVIHLSLNHFAMEIPPWLFNLTMNFVDFRAVACSLRGSIPETLRHQKNLTMLNLAVNAITGPIPSFIGNLSSLKWLYLCRNNFNGTLPESLGLLTRLTIFSIGQNPLQGQLGEKYFLNLSNLKDMSINSPDLTMNISSGWTPPFQLEKLVLCCKVGPLFPSWLLTQISLTSLTMSNSSISGIVPTWFWRWASQIDHMDLSNNQISGDVSDILLNSTYINLSSNNFKGELTQVPNHVESLNIANNSISGSLSYWMCKSMSRNSSLHTLDVSNNRLSGELGDCWGQWVSLEYLNLASNQFSGRIPNSVGALHELRALSFRNNSFTGNIPSTFQKLSKLWILDLSDNQLSEKIPLWIWGLKNLSILRLRSNRFGGHFSDMVCQLSSLIVLDLANNSLIGSLPNCFQEMKEMVFDKDRNVKSIYLSNDVLASTFYELFMNYCIYHFPVVVRNPYYTINFVLYPKGHELEYRSDQAQIVRLIDLSYNKLTGRIPSSINGLAALHYLILAGNLLHGEIPKDIGRMNSLETLDLSSNLLSGNIPRSLSELSSLSVLNLSYNHLSGPIPASTQLQGFNDSCFIGNPELCGLPLPVKCINDDESHDRHDIGVIANDDDNSLITPEDLYMGAGVGFAFGFCGVCCTLFFNISLRNASFGVMQNLVDQVCERVVLYRIAWKAKLCRLCFVLIGRST